MGQRAGPGPGCELLVCRWHISHLHPHAPASSQLRLAKPRPRHVLRTLGWIRILNQINSGIGRKAVCREPIHTPPSPSFWPAAGIWGLGKHTLRASSIPLPPTHPSAFQSTLPCLLPILLPIPSLVLTLSPGPPSTLEDTQFLGQGEGGVWNQLPQRKLTPVTVGIWRSR